MADQHSSSSDEEWPTESLTHWYTRIHEPETPPLRPAELVLEDVVVAPAPPPAPATYLDAAARTAYLVLQAGLFGEPLTIPLPQPPPTAAAAPPAPAKPNKKRKTPSATAEETKMPPPPVAMHAPLKTPCTKTFTNPDDEARHRELHTEKRPYACPEPECAACFTQRQLVGRHHRDVHERKRPFMCGVKGCDRVFSQTSHANAHTDAHRRAIQAGRRLPRQPGAEEEPKAKRTKSADT